MWKLVFFILTEVLRKMGHGLFLYQKDIVSEIKPRKMVLKKPWNNVLWKFWGHNFLLMNTCLQNTSFGIWQKWVWIINTSHKTMEAGTTYLTLLTLSFFIFKIRIIMFIWWAVMTIDLNMYAEKKWCIVSTQ